MGESHPATEPDIEVHDMNDALIDPYQIEMMQEEIRMNPLNEDDRTKELIALYKFQQRLIRQWEEDQYKSRGG